jgi:SAM-dependent methyltransferase
MSINEAKLQEFMGKFVMDLGALLHAPLVILGERLGLYKAMNGTGPISAGELAERTKTDARYIQEWLAANAASGYVDYDSAVGRYTLSPEQGAALADETSPAYIPGAFQLALAGFHAVDKITDAYRSGKGVGWHEHHHCLFEGTERFFRPGYAANLVSSWLPSLEGVEAKLRSGARVADVGCGHGASTVLMAQAYPKSTFIGFDYHAPSIEAARRAADKAGVSDRCRFETAKAKDFPGKGYDLVAFFDCLHDMGDPVGAAAHVRQSLAADGAWMIVEPNAGDRIEDNLNPVGRIFYSASSWVCTPASKSQEVGLALGACAGEARLRDVVLGGGFTRFRRTTQTPFNMVLEARI